MKEIRKFVNNWRIMLSKYYLEHRPANVILCHVGRVGSTVLMNLLNQHHNVDWYGEIYHAKNFERYKMQYGEESSLNLLRLVTAPSRTKIIGFNFKFHRLFDLKRIDVSPKKLVEGLDRNNFKYAIILERKNLLRRHISEIVGAKRKIWHHKQKEGVEPDLTEIEIDLEKAYWGGEVRPLFEWFSEIEDSYNYFRSLAHEHDWTILELTYEDDILPDPMIAYQKICSFLKIAPESPKITYKRSNPFALYDILSNFDDIQRCLSGTKYEWMLEN